MLVYYWSVNYSPGAAYCVATAITSMHFFQPSTAVLFMQSIQQHTVAEPVIMLWLYCNMWNVIIYQTVLHHLLVSSNVFSQFTQQHIDVDKCRIFKNSLNSYHFILVCLHLDSEAELTCWLRWCALKQNMTKPVNMWTVIETISGADL